MPTRDCLKTIELPDRSPYKLLKCVATEGVFLQCYATANHPLEVAERLFRQSQGAVPRTPVSPVFDEHRVGPGRDKGQW
jgi:hypothetical protein